MSLDLATRPDNVPSQLVVNADIYALEGGETDPQMAWKALDKPDGPGLVWTPHNEGHWIATSAELIWSFLGDGDRFSAKTITVPPATSIYPMVPNESDEPEHKYYRKIVTPFVGPKQVRELGENVRALAIELIDGFKDLGRCEFVSEFAKHLPMRIFLSLVDLPETDREWLIEQADTGVRGKTVEDRTGAQRNMFGYLKTWVDERRDNPGDDLLSAIVRGMVADRPMTEEEVMGESMDVMFGGLDTVASMMGFIMRFLATHPDHYATLVEDPSRVTFAVEELLRRHGVATIARRAMTDVEVDGVTIKAGDMVILPTALHGLDQRHWDDPLTVDFNRPRKTHGTFGNGVHNCPGAGLARSEIAIMLEEWIKRIPAFSIDPDKPPVTATGSVNGMISLNLVWPVN